MWQYVIERSWYGEDEKEDHNDIIAGPEFVSSQYSKANVQKCALLKHHEALADIDPNEITVYMVQMEDA